MHDLESRYGADGAQMTLLLLDDVGEWEVCHGVWGQDGVAGAFLELQPNTAAGCLAVVPLPGRLAVGERIQGCADAAIGASGHHHLVAIQNLHQLPLDVKSRMRSFTTAYFALDPEDNVLNNGDCKSLRTCIRLPFCRKTQHVAARLSGSLSLLLSDLYAQYLPVLLHSCKDDL